MKVKYEQTTLEFIGKQKLVTICDNIGFVSQRVTAVKFFELMSASWGDWKLKDHQILHSDLSDDGSPYEFSVTYKNNQPELRFMVEPQGLTANYQANWDASLLLNNDLENIPSVDLSRFKQIYQLISPFTNISPNCTYAFWYGVDIHIDGKYMFKVYFNLEARGPKNAPDLLREMLTKLGLAKVWQNLIEPRLKESEEMLPKWLALDLTNDVSARIKTYFISQNTESIYSQLKNSSNYKPEEGLEDIKKVTGNAKYIIRPIVSCFAYLDPTTPPIAKIYIPIRFYIDNDIQALERAQSYLSPEEYSSLKAAATKVADRPLELHQCLISYIGLRVESNGKKSVTLYISPELYSDLKPKLDNTDQQSKDQPTERFNTEMLLQHLRNNSNSPSFTSAQKKSIVQQAPNVLQILIKNRDYRTASHLNQCIQQENWGAASGIINEAQTQQAVKMSSSIILGQP